LFILGFYLLLPNHFSAFFLSNNRLSRGKEPAQRAPQRPIQREEVAHQAEADARPQQETRKRALEMTIRSTFRLLATSFGFSVALTFGSRKKASNASRSSPSNRSPVKPASSPPLSLAPNSETNVFFRASKMGLGMLITIDVNND